MFASTTVTAVVLAQEIKTWWEANKHRTEGPYGEKNVFNDEPEFVRKAKEVIGNWEAT